MTSATTTATPALQRRGVVLGQPDDVSVAASDVPPTARSDSPARRVASNVRSSSRRPSRADRFCVKRQRPYVEPAATTRDDTLAAAHASLAAASAVLDRIRGVGATSDSEIAELSAATEAAITAVNVARTEHAAAERAAAHASYVYSLAILPDGLLPSGSYDKMVRVWHLRSGSCALTLGGHTNWVSSLAVLPDGRLASGSYDTTVRVWDLRSGSCALTLRGHTSSVSSLAVLPDGRLASGSFDTTVRVWS